MRQGQQHRRGRGRNNSNNNRKGQNPLARSFESNGPDVKVRGTPAHIAEKYISLARDAQSSGDPVLAENYLQHAEHYNRIIMAYREQHMQQSGEMANGNGQRMRPAGMEGPDGEDFLDEGGDDFGQSDQPMVQGFHQDQPRSHGGGQRGDDNRHRHNDHGRFRDRHDRHDRNDRPYDRQNNDFRQGRDRGAEGPQAAEGAPQQGGAQQPRSSDQGERRRRERFGPGNEQPDFLRRPVRRPRREGANGEAEEAVETSRDEAPHDKNSA